VRAFSRISRGSAEFIALTGCFCSRFIVGSGGVLFKKNGWRMPGPQWPQSGHLPVFYENVNLVRLSRLMIDRPPDLTSTRRAAMLLLLLAGSLGGCADVGDSFVSSAFVDPARYDLYDCKQLEGERKWLAVRTAELQGLIAKAGTVTGGAVVGELAYRNDYIAVRGQAKLVEEMWRRNKCVATTPAAATPLQVPAQPKGAAATSGLY
jgi:hypothetical protein